MRIQSLDVIFWEMIANMRRKIRDALRELLKRHRLHNLHRSGALTDEEYAAAKTAVGKDCASADAAADQPQPGYSEESALPDAVVSLDQAWALERESYMVADKNGHLFLPGRWEGVAGCVISISMGGWIAAGATSMPNSWAFDPLPAPVFHVLIILFGVGLGIHHFRKACQYEAAYQAYDIRRAQLLAGHSEGISLPDAVVHLDRAWTVTRKRYLMVDSNEYGFHPGGGACVLFGVVAVTTGLFIISSSASVEQLPGDWRLASLLAPPLGAFLILWGVGWNIYTFLKARQYEAAYHAYHIRRAQLLAGR
jgi:hypothetical protein